MFRKSSDYFVASVVSTLVLAGATATAQTQTTYQLTDLGALPGSTRCAASGVNDTGLVVGYCASDATFMTTVGFVWRNGVMTSIGKLTNGHYSQSHAINAAGVVAGEADAGDFQPRAVIARDGALLNIDPTGGANIRAIGISNSGVIAGDFASGLSGNTKSWRAVVWTEDPTHPGRFNRTTLPLVAGGDTKARSSYAIASNNGGQVVGWVTNSLFGQLGALWNNDAAHGVSTLNPLPGGYMTIALGVNDFGQAVGLSSTFSASNRAVLWTSDSAHTPIDLGVVADDTESAAAAINNVGQIVGVSRSAAGVVHGFVWQNGQMADLQSLLDATGAGWSIQDVAAINNRGQIVGAGVFNGQLRAILLTPFVQ